jgi:penicillin-binding protein 2
VLAMVSNPSFDPNLFVTGISFKEYAALRDSIDRPLFNRVLRGLYAPGSTIKPEVAIAGLDSGVVTAQTRVFDPGYYQLPDFDHKYRNWNHSGDGWVDMDAAIMRSNDTYFTTWRTSLASTVCTTTWRNSALVRKSRWICSKSRQV